MNLEQNYDVVEGKGKVAPRAIGMGDVLAHSGGSHWEIFARGDRHLVLASLQDGSHYSEGTSVKSVGDLSRQEARLLCGGNPDCFRLVGRAKDVLTVQDPGD